MPNLKVTRKLWWVSSMGLFVAAAAAFLFFRKGEYEIVIPKWGPIVEAVYGIGTVTPSHIYQVKYGVAATLEEIYVREGDLVKAKAPLMRIDRRVIAAPFEGTVTAIPFNVGENVFAGTPLLTLTDLKQLYLQVSLEQQGALRVKAGQNVQISFDSLRGMKIAGRVRTIYPNADQFLARVEVSNLPAEILPGMTADVAIEVDKKDHVQLIPIQAVSSGKIMVRQGGRRKKLDIKVGNIDGQWAEVLSPELPSETEILLQKASHR